MSDWLRTSTVRNDRSELTRVLRESWNLFRQENELEGPETSEAEFRQLLSDHGFMRDHTRKGSITKGLILTDLAWQKVLRARQEDASNEGTPNRYSN
jgi:hypothetical protein